MTVQLNAGAPAVLPSGVASGALVLTAPPFVDAIKILVTAGDGVTTKLYTINLNHTQADANLAYLTVSTGTLAPPFATGIFAYAMTVNSAVTSMTVTPTSDYGPTGPGITTARHYRCHRSEPPRSG